MNLLTTFASNLREQRAKKNLSQVALAKKAGLSVSYISMLEREQRSPPLDTLEAIGRALSLPAVDLLS
jgi:transcriptional regulator with XRE-family HTH domain